MQSPARQASGRENRRIEFSALSALFRGFLRRFAFGRRLPLRQAIHVRLPGRSSEQVQVPWGRYLLGHLIEAAVKGSFGSLESIQKARWRAVVMASGTRPAATRENDGNVARRSSGDFWSFEGQRPRAGRFTSAEFSTPAMRLPVSGQGGAFCSNLRPTRFARTVGDSLGGSNARSRSSRGSGSRWRSERILV